jgi:hypothetical protein
MIVLTSLVIAGVFVVIIPSAFSLFIINGVPVVHAQSTFAVPPPPTSQIIQQPGTTFAQPCVNNGTNVIESGKQILNQENQCNGTRVTQPPTSNGQPIANAGPSQVVSRGSLVTLDGTGSSAQNGATIVSYSWVQTSGITASLSGANTVTPTFVAPTNSTILVFSLTVTDNNGAVSSPSTVTVTVV